MRNQKLTKSRNATPARRLLPALIGGVLASAAATGQDAVLTDREGQSRTVPLVPDSSVKIESNGDISLTPVATSEAWKACLGAGSGACQVDIGGTFRTNASTVSKGATFTVSWDARGAWDCVGSMKAADGTIVTSTTWDDEPLRGPRGSETIDTSTLEFGDYSMILTCQNGAIDAETLAISVVDSNPDAPAFCSDEGRVPPTGITRDAAIKLGSPDETVTWFKVFSAEFPKGNTQKIEIDRDRYAALAFSSVGVDATTKGNLAFEDPQTAGDTVTNGNKLVTISECPGDFTNPADSLESPRDPECRWYGSVNNFRYTVGTGINGDFRCDIEAGKTYYLNVLYTADCSSTGYNPRCANDDGGTLTWKCTGPSDRCGNNVDHLEGN